MLVQGYREPALVPSTLHAAFLVFLARAAEAPLIAADLRNGPDILFHRRVLPVVVMIVILIMVAIGAVHVRLVGMLMPVVMIMGAIRTMHVRFVGRRVGLGRILGHSRNLEGA